MKRVLSKDYGPESSCNFSWNNEIPWNSVNISTRNIRVHLFILHPLPPPPLSVWNLKHCWTIYSSRDPSGDQSGNRWCERSGDDVLNVELSWHGIGCFWCRSPCTARSLNKHYFTVRLSTSQKWSKLSHSHCNFFHYLRLPVILF